MLAWCRSVIVLALMIELAMLVALSEMQKDGSVSYHSQRGPGYWTRQNAEHSCLLMQQ